MSEDLGAHIPEPIDEPSADGRQSLGAPDVLPSDSKRGGAISVVTVSETLEDIFEKSPRSLGSQAASQLIIGILRERDFKAYQAEQNRQKTADALAQKQNELTVETVNRKIAEERLSNLEKQEPKDKLCIAVGIVLFTMGIDMVPGAMGFSLLILGLVLIWIGALWRRTKR